MSDENGARSSFWKNFGPVLLLVAAGAISLVVAMTGDADSRQDVSINDLVSHKTQVQERLGRIETDIEHVKRSQSETREDVREIRRLLEGRPRGVER